MVNNEVAYFVTVLKNVFQISVLSGVVYLVTLLYYVPKRKIVLFTSLDFVKHTVTPYNIHTLCSGTKERCLIHDQADYF